MDLNDDEDLDESKVNDKDEGGVEKHLAILDLSYCSNNSINTLIRFVLELEIVDKSKQIRALHS